MYNKAHVRLFFNFSGPMTVCLFKLKRISEYTNDSVKRGTFVGQKQTLGYPSAAGRIYNHAQEGRVGLAKLL